MGRPRKYDDVIAALLAQGYGTGQIAEMLAIRPSTVYRSRKRAERTREEARERAER